MFGAIAHGQENVSAVVFEKMMVHSSDADIVTDGVMTGGRRIHN